MEYVTGDQGNPKKVHFEDAFVPTTLPPPSPPPEEVPAVKDEEVAQNPATEDKVVIPIPEENASPPTAPVKEIAYAAVKKDIEGSKDRDLLCAQIEKEKRLALIRAWEESEKSKAENKACRRMSAVESWENTKKTSIEAELRKLEEKYERKKAEYVEKMNNKVVGIHKLGAEKRAFIEAKQKEQFLKVEETAAKFRASGHTPKKLLLGCFVFPHSAII